MCTNLIDAYQLITENDTSPLLFKAPHPSQLYRHKQTQVTCGKCIACLKSRSLGRAIQLYCELKTCPGESWFLTLTIDNDHLNKDFSLSKPIMTNFLKRLRQYRVRNKHAGKFRYEQVGEYGENTLRPHHHMCAYNLQLDDLAIVKNNDNNSGTPYQEYRSETLNQIWEQGDVLIIKLVFESCIYVAQHTDKKIGTHTSPHKRPVSHPVSGKTINCRLKEYATRSSKPGIGLDWYRQYGSSDLYTLDSFITPNGKQSKIPNYFDQQLKKDDPDLFELVKLKRIEKAKTKTLDEQHYQANFNKVMAKQKKRNKI